MKFLVDNQLPPALARFLVDELEAEALHVTDVDLQHASDGEIWAYASARRLIVVSKDADFVTLYSKLTTAALLWVRLGNYRRNLLLLAFDKSWPGIVHRFASGDRFVELR